MAYLALSGTNPSANVQNNMRRLWIEYTLNTPIAVPLGQEFDLATLFPNNPKMTMTFKTKKGTFDVMTRMPLSLLACLYGLEQNKSAYVVATSKIPAASLSVTGTGTLDAIPPTLVNVPVTGTASLPETQLEQFVSKISFAVDVFEVGRTFTNGDLMEISVVDMPGGDSIKIFISDFPYMSDSAKPYKFRAQTVLQDNDYQVDFSGKLIFPNDTAKIDSIQMNGNNFVQWDLTDFYANADSDWVSNKTTYNSSPFIFLDTELLTSVKFKAKNQFQFYYKTKFTGNNG